jgi:hypothetical protein
LCRLSEAGNEKYYYELYARSGLIFVIRLKEDALIVPTSS